MKVFPTAIVISTQKEFEQMIASPTWLNAKSILFVGQNKKIQYTKRFLGLFKIKRKISYEEFCSQYDFIKKDGIGLKIPSNVMQIYGINNPRIFFTDFNYSEDNQGCIWKEENNYSCEIDNIHLIMDFGDCDKEPNIWIGFTNVACFNCISTGVYTNNNYKKEKE